jgi:NAD(P)-dependent dehydrogenase (short-subunit alcohol dehydrogenase family)
MSRLEDKRARIPAGRRGRPDEIAQAMLFLAADEAPFAVGASSSSTAG